uniref:Uncharacterized protein n=1 Tax=Arundo donax TaxID=35708 RepID=A0A0A9E1W1_ARUDO
MHVVLRDDQVGRALLDHVVHLRRVNLPLASLGVGLDGIEVGFPAGGQDVPALVGDGEGCGFGLRRRHGSTLSAHQLLDGMSLRWGLGRGIELRRLEAAAPSPNGLTSWSRL